MMANVWINIPYMNPVGYDSNNQLVVFTTETLVCLIEFVNIPRLLAHQKCTPSSHHLFRFFTLILYHTVDGRNPFSPVEVGSLSHYLQGFIHSRRCRISAINSILLFLVYLKSILTHEPRKKQLLLSIILVIEWASLKWFIIITPT